MFIPSVKNKVYNWEEYTLLVPLVSVGNVGQLTADLIISTLWMDRIGFIMHEAITPAVGNNPFAHADATACKLTSCCEVYESASTQVMVIQQRAPLIKGRVKSYVKFLSDWIKEKKFYQVVLVGSTFSHERLDHQMQGPPFRIVMSDKMQKRSGDVLKCRLGWTEMEPRPSLLSDGATQDQSLTGTLYMPGSGIARPLLEACRDLPVLLFLMFCSEGDNAQDAIDVAQQLNGWMNLISRKEERRNSIESKDVAQGIVDWKIPTSWKHFYGAKFDQTLFH
ncbi:proteasome assembly chaperone 2-like [Babylonia areolata]|uniref:proteasome assembly chaperone 2-like n=1 Tax=Babylonia areolata TaxID=304850 RepID=UPI003FD54751